VSNVELLIAAGTALACGLLIGFERERSHGAATIPGGIRTYALIGLTGLVAAAIGPWVAAVGLLLVGGLIAIGYLRTSRTDVGATSEVAALTAYGIGALAWTRPGVSAGLAVAVTVVLASKERLHHFVRDVVTDTELEDALKFFIAAFVVLPLLPAGAIGPYGVLDPRRIWTIVVVLTGVNAIGYIATRALGAGRGLAITGLAGGFVSASATTGAMALRARVLAVRPAALAAALLASVSTLVQLVGLVAVAYPPLLPPVLPMAVVGVITLLAIAWAVSRRAAPVDASTEDDTSTPSPGRLFALVPALILAGLLTTATLVARWGVDVFGPSGIVAAGGLAGLADAHAGALAAATVLQEGVITTTAALLAIAAALVANTIVKVVLAFVGGGAAVGWRYVGLMLVPIVSIGITLGITVLLVD
jgi:uncharacterized membrane protein (DUF4010 family)